MKIGIIGVGAIAQVAHIPTWNEYEDVQLAVFDINHHKATRVAEKFGVSQVYGNIDDMFKDDEIVAVDICTPTDSHCEIVSAALLAGKHVLVEKPIALNYTETLEIIKIARKKKKRLMVATNVRFREDAKILRTFIQQGELGDVFYCKAGWLRQRGGLISHNHWFARPEISGGGVFIDLGVQVLDLSLWLLGEPQVLSVSASAFNEVSNFPVEDSAAVFIRLANNATLTIEVSWTLLSDKDFFYTNLFGKHGGALLNPLRVHKEFHGNLVNLTPLQEKSEKNLYKRSYENEILHFKNSIIDDQVEILSYDAILERMRVVDAVYKSAATGREVILSE